MKTFINQLLFSYRSEQFKFSQLSQNLQQQKQQQPINTDQKKLPRRTMSCDDTLLTGANKRFVLLYNMNIVNILYIYDIQKDETKEFPWDESIIYPHYIIR